MFSGEKAAALFGLVSGLFADAMASGIFGLRAVMFLFFGYMIAFLTEKILSRNVISCALTGILSVGFSELAEWGIFCQNTPVDFATAAQYVFLPRVVMSLPVVLFLYYVFTLLYRERDVYPVRR
jgi:rod shape-determining protein MreD